jgi:hypothetical protein
MPLLLNTSIKLFTMSSLDMFGFSFENAGLVLGLSDLVAIVFLLFSGFGVMPGAQARFQISPIREVDQPSFISDSFGFRSISIGVLGKVQEVYIQSALKVCPSMAAIKSPWCFDKMWPIGEPSGPVN